MDLSIIAYSDADWASNPNDWKSISGNAFLLGGAAIGWLSKKQAVTTKSTCDAEYVSAATCARHVNWLRNLFLYLGFPLTIPTPIYCDNQAAISLTKNFQFHSKSKHIDIHHHYIRDKVSDGSLTVSYVPSAENPADVLTKRLPKFKHEKFSRELGLIPA